ncbi:MAG: O-antigen ligase family protein [Acidobacteriota bacterium]
MSVAPVPSTTVSSGRGPSAAAGVGFTLVMLHLVTIWGLALSNILLGMALLWVAYRWRELDWSRVGAAWRQPFGGVLKPLAVYLAAFAISVASSYDPSSSSRSLSDLFSAATLPLVVVLAAQVPQLRRLADLLIAVGVGVAAIGLWQFVFAGYGSIDRRMPGPFSHYMTFSGVLLLALCLVLARLALPRRSTRARWVEWTCLAVLVATLVLTLTRSAWLGALAAVVLGVAYRGWRRLAALFGLLTLASALIAAWAPGHWERVRSIADPTDISNYDRLCMAQAGLKMTSERPFFGIGPGMVAERYPIYRHATAPRDHVKHLHSTPVHTAAERGLVGFASYVWLMVAGLLLALRQLRLGGEGSEVALGAALAIVAFNVAGLFEANWRDTELQRWMLFLLAAPACLELARGRVEPSAKTA